MAYLRRQTASSGELRRRTATSGDEQCTGERGELERGASSARGEWERGSVSFYREREGRGKGDAREVMGRRRPSLAIDGVGYKEDNGGRRRNGRIKLH
jgi:hypothetical protein